MLMCINFPCTAVIISGVACNTSEDTLCLILLLYEGGTQMLALVSRYQATRRLKHVLCYTELSIAIYMNLRLFVAP